MSISSKELARSKIEKLVNKWNNSTGSDFTEQDTVTNFILPFLEALGWDIYNVYEVKQGGYPSSLRKTVPVESRSSKKPDCVISLNDNPLMVFEFKPLKPDKRLSAQLSDKIKTSSHIGIITLTSGSGESCSKKILSSRTNRRVLDVSHLFSVPAYQMINLIFGP